MRLWQKGQKHYLKKNIRKQNKNQKIINKRNKNNVASNWMPAWGTWCKRHTTRCNTKYKKRGNVNVWTVAKRLVRSFAFGRYRVQIPAAAWPRVGFFLRGWYHGTKDKANAGSSTHPRANLPIIVAEKARKASSAAGMKNSTFFFSIKERDDLKEGLGWKRDKKKETKGFFSSLFNSN